MRIIYVLASMLLTLNVVAQDLDALAHKYAKEHFDTFRQLLSLPNDAHFEEHIVNNFNWCSEAFASRGFHSGMIETDGPPLIYLDRQSPSAIKTVLIYLQADGQPVDPEYWFQENPYKPVLKEQAADGGWEQIGWEQLEGELDPDWRIFARSASDAKGPISMFLAAIDAIDDLGIEPNFNMKVVIDLEEELGSPHLPDAVKNARDALSADALIIFDGPMHITNKPTLTFGARGISTVTLTVHGPVFPQHSGHYGNYCPNPAMRLAQLLATMKDGDGVVSIAGWYDGIEISDETREILEAVPDDERVIRARLGVAGNDKVAPTYQQSLQYPSLNVRGMAAGWVGDEVRTIVPSSATAEIDIRLVVESDPERLLSLLRSHIEAQGYYITDSRPTSEERKKYDRICEMSSETSYLAFRTDFDSDVGKWLTSALTNAYGSVPIRQRTSGGSIPISPFVTTLGIPAVTVPTVNRDNNQHSPNENLRVGNYIDGIKTMLAILSEPF